MDALLVLFSIILVVITVPVIAVVRIVKLRRLKKEAMKQKRFTINISVTED